MDDLKQGYREAEQATKEAARAADGTDLQDHVGNIGDETNKNLGNLGDDVPEGADRTFPDEKVSDRQM